VNAISLARAIIVATSFVLAPIAATADGPPDVVKYVTLPSRVGLGYYVPLREGEPNRLTDREGDEFVRRGYPQEPDRNMPLAGVVKYSKSHGMAISLQSDKHGDINEKLPALRAFDPADVRSLICIGHLNEAGLHDIASLVELRELMIEASDILESPKGSRQVSELMALKYLEIIPGEDRKFGSGSFCRTVISLKKLQFLSMPCEKLTDENVKTLAGHPTLERLYLLSTKPVLGRGSLHALNRMEKLRELAIVCTEDITDTDVMGFAEIRSLELLSIATKAPLTCKERFEARRPDCKLYLIEPFDELE